MTNTSERELLDGIVEHPLELDRWLILADWLEEYDDPRRAELASIRHALHNDLLLLPHDAARYQTRQLELLAEGVPPPVPSVTGPLGIEMALMLPGSLRRLQRSVARLFDTQPLTYPLYDLVQPFFLGTCLVTNSQFLEFQHAANYHTLDERAHIARRETEHREIASRRPTASPTPPARQRTIRKRTGPVYEADPYSRFSRPHSDQPATRLSAEDGQALCDWLNKQGGPLLYCLPDACQWEYGFRAGTDTVFWWGDNIGPEGVHYRTERLGVIGEFHTPNVRSLQINPWGLHHLFGLVSEPCRLNRYRSVEAQCDGVLCRGGELRGETFPPDRVVATSASTQHSGLRLAASWRDTSDS